MFNWFLNTLDRHGRKLIIMDRDNIRPYLERYYVMWPDSVKRERKDIPFNGFLHRFMLSDDPVFHNHPWDWYRTVILKGGYWEHTPWGTFWRGPGHTRLVRGGQWIPYNKEDPNSPNIPSDSHWIEIPKSGETWTFFMRGRTVRDWGFIPNPQDGHWIRWDVYLEQQRVKNNV